jgi:hypothetical protein
MFYFEILIKNKLCFFNLAIKNESSGNIRNMAEFCQQIPISIEHLLRVRN